MLSSLQVSCLAVFPGENRFIIGSKRLLLFTNDSTRKDIKAYNDDIFPIRVEFNPYFNTFHALTK